MKNLPLLLAAAAALLFALGCGRKEAPEPVAQVLPAAVAEPEQTPEPEPARKPPAAIQPDAAPDTTAADSVTAAAWSERVITDEEFKRMPVYIDYWTPVGYRPKEPTGGTYHALTGEEVERKGGIFEAVKTLPGVTGR